MAIAQKELNETLYWLELLKETDYFNNREVENMHKDTNELIKFITSIIKTSKRKINN